MPLQEERDHPLHGPEGAAVDHHDPLPLPRGGDIGQVEAFGLVEVELHGREGLLVAPGVEHLHVDLGSVERGLARLRVPGQPGRRRDVVEHRAQRLLRLGPLRGLAEPAAGVVPAGQAQVGHLDAQGLEHLQHGDDGGAHLRPDLVGTAEHVRVVEIDLPHAAQPGEHTGPLRAEHRGELRVPHGQVAVGTGLGRVDLRVVRAVGGTQHEGVGVAVGRGGAVRGAVRTALGATEVHGREHVVGELGPVARALVQRALAEHRRVDGLAAGAQRDLARVLLQLVPDGGAGRQPQGQAGTDQRAGVEDPHVAAELAMVDDGGRRGCVVACGDVHGGAPSTGSMEELSRCRRRVRQRPRSELRGLVAGCSVSARRRDPASSCVR